MEIFWTAIGGTFLGFALGSYVGIWYGYHSHRKCSIPPSESLDTQKRMKRLVEETEDEGVSPILRNTLDQRSRTSNGLCGISMPRSAKK